jgi:hypothetical protein
MQKRAIELIIDRDTLQVSDFGACFEVERL